MTQFFVSGFIFLWMNVFAYNNADDGSFLPHKELISQAGLDPSLDGSHKERLRQYSQVSLQGELLERGWCSLVPQLLESTEHDYREKVCLFFTKIVWCFYIKLAWKKFRLPVHMDFFICFLLLLFFPGTTSIVGDGSRVFKTVQVWQLSNGLPADSQGPVPWLGPVRNYSGRGERIFCRDDRTYRCLTGPDKMKREYYRVTIKRASQRREDYAGLHMKQPLFNQATNHRRTHLLHARKVWETLLTRTMSDPKLDYWKTDH